MFLVSHELDIKASHACYSQFCVYPQYGKLVWMNDKRGFSVPRGPAAVFVLDLLRILFLDNFFDQRSLL